MRNKPEPVKQCSFLELLVELLNRCWSAFYAWLRNNCWVLGLVIMVGGLGYHIFDWQWWLIMFSMIILVVSTFYYEQKY